MKDFSETTRFWMVINLSGRGTPVVRHPTPAHAEDEAKRLAAKSNERECFAVLESGAVYQRQEPVVDAYVPNNEGKYYWVIA